MCCVLCVVNSDDEYVEIFFDDQKRAVVLNERTKKNGKYLNRFVVLNDKDNIAKLKCTADMKLKLGLLYQIIQDTGFIPEIEQDDDFYGLKNMVIQTNDED